MPVAPERITFTGSQGDDLAARLDRPVGPVRATAVFAHCFTCSKDIAAASRISRALTGHGIAVLRFDFTGLGHSGGEFGNTNFSSNIEDLVRAAGWLRENLEAPSLLVGHSLGGAAVLAVADRIPEAKAMATIGAPSDPAHLQHLLPTDVDEIGEDAEVEVDIAGRAFTIRRQFIDDIRSYDLETSLQSQRRALLVLHSPADDTVDIEHASRIFMAAHHPKSFVSLDKADHLLSRRDDAVYAADVIAAWADRYVEPPPDSDVLHAAEGEVVVRETGDGKFQTAVAAGRHALVADEPTSVGGQDTGPTPYGLLLAALGSCTSMTLRLYAEHKGLALERVGVRLRHDKIHAEDCADCETRSGKIDSIEREITLKGDLTDEQRARLLEIADKCPVHRTLHSEVHVISRVSDH